MSTGPPFPYKLVKLAENLLCTAFSHGNRHVLETPAVAPQSKSVRGPHCITLNHSKPPMMCLSNFCISEYLYSQQQFQVENKIPSFLGRSMGKGLHLGG